MSLLSFDQLGQVIQSIRSANEILKLIFSFDSLMKKKKKKTDSIHWYFW